MSGTEAVSVFGCAMSFQGLQFEHRVLASICARNRKKSIVAKLVTSNRADSEPLKVTLNDKTMVTTPLVAQQELTRRSGDRFVVMPRRAFQPASSYFRCQACDFAILRMMHQTIHF